jgi:soluble lytic murein transglycosylase-like protein
MFVASLECMQKKNMKRVRILGLSCLATFGVAAAAGAQDSDPTARTLLKESGVKQIATGAEATSLVAEVLPQRGDEKKAKQDRKKAKQAKKAKQPEVPQPENGTIEGVSLETLDTIAACESGGDPTAVNPAGYYGKYQFDMQTWAAVGGSGNPAAAPEAEQDYRAALLYNQSGSSPWPVCGI